MDKVGVVITLVVLGIVAFVGMNVMGAMGDDLEQAQDALHDRGYETYGEDYVIVQSESCWDMCAPTATANDQQRSDMRYVLARSGGLLTKQELADGAVGLTSDLPTDALAAEPSITTRTVGGETRYRYTGTETPPIMSDATVRDRVAQRLYVTGGSMAPNDIADDLPVGEGRVRIALHQLDRTGVVDGGYVTYQFLPQYEWIHTDHGTLPDSRWSHWKGPLIITGILGAVVGVIALFQRRKEVG